MKKTNRILFLFLTTIVTVFSSCTVDVEPIDPTVLDENPIINPGENPANPSGDYWPMAINNQWTYKKNGTIVNCPQKVRHYLGAFLWKEKSSTVMSLNYNV